MLRSVKIEDLDTDYFVFERFLDTDFVESFVTLQ